MFSPNIEKLKAKQNIKALVNALKYHSYSDGRSSQIRMEAAAALDSLGWEPQNATEKSYYLLAKRQWKELRDVNTPAIKFLMNQLRVGTLDVGWQFPGDIQNAAMELGEIGAIEAIPLIIDTIKKHVFGDENRYKDKQVIVSCLASVLEKLVEDTDWRQERKTPIEKILETITTINYYKITGIDREFVIKKLASVLKKIDKSVLQPSIQKTIKRGFTQKGMSETFPVPIMVLAGPSGESIRACYATTLSQLGDLAFDELVNTLELSGNSQDEKMMRKYAAISLGEMGDRRAIEYLRNVLRENKLDHDLENAVNKSLRKLEIIESSSYNSLGKICLKCGKKAQVKALFCPSCGEIFPKQMDRA